MLLFKIREAAWPVQVDIWIHIVSSNFLPTLNCFIFLSLSRLYSTDWCQQMSEPTYGFVLFDYISGNLEEQTDKSQLLQTDKGEKGERE